MINSTKDSNIIFEQNNQHNIDDQNVDNNGNEVDTVSDTTDKNEDDLDNDDLIPIR